MSEVPRVRVLQVLDSHDLGGAQRVVLNYVRHLDRRRFAVEVAAMHGPGVFTPAFLQAGVPVHLLSPHRFLPLYLLRLPRLLPRFDLVHLHLFGSIWIGQPLAFLAGRRVRYTHDHCNDAFRSGSRLVTRLDSLAARLATRILAVSQSTRDYLVEREGVPPAKIEIFPNTVDPGEFAPATPSTREAARRRFGLPAEALVIGGAGRLVAQKNFALFLEVLSAVGRLLPADAASRCRGLIAGTGPDEEALRRQAAALGLAERVVFAGHVDPIGPLYAASDVLLMPSRFEGLPMTLLEAMCSGLPVVASRLDGIMEVVDDPHEGLLADPADGPAMAGHVASLLGDPGRRTAMAAAARAKVTAHFAADTVTRRLEALYLADVKCLFPHRGLG